MTKRRLFTALPLLLCTLFMTACSHTPSQPKEAFCLNGADEAFVCGTPPPDTVVLPETEVLLQKSRDTRHWLQSMLEQPAVQALHIQQTFYTAQLGAFRKPLQQWPDANLEPGQPRIIYAISKRLWGAGVGMFTEPSQAGNICRRLKEAQQACLIYALKPGVEVKYVQE